MRRIREDAFKRMSKPPCTPLAASGIGSTTGVVVAAEGRDCRLVVSDPYVCEDGYRWLSLTCLKHGDTWRELVSPSSPGTGTPSCTTRASAWTLAGYRVFRSRRELESWLSAEDDSDDSDEA